VTDPAHADGPLAERVAKRLRPIRDFPRSGILFQDITPVLADPALFAAIVDWYLRIAVAAKAEMVACIEARGFLFGAAVALAGQLPLIPLRKPGKLPGTKLRQEYALEYGNDALEMHTDAASPGSRILVVDDLLASGGTAGAACALLERVDAKVAAVAAVIEIETLGGRRRLAAYPCHCLVRL
jgi:adenine phosphoribosyltransferase